MKEVGYKLAKYIIIASVVTVALSAGPDKAEVKQDEIINAYTEQTLGPCKNFELYMRNSQVEEDTLNYYLQLCYINKGKND